MATQPSVSLDSLSERLTRAVIKDLTKFLDMETIATAALAHIADQHIVASDPSIAEEDLGLLGFAIEDGMSETILEYRIERAITRSLEDAGVTNEPPAALDASVIRQQIGEAVNVTVNAAMANFRPPQPSVLSMDVTALREQILSSFYHLQSIIRLVCLHKLTKVSRTANCRVIHDLYNSPLPNKTSPTEILITSDGDGLFRAFAIRTFPKQGIVITTEGLACATTVEALETLYRKTCDVLARARGRAKETGGDLGSWKHMRL
jgi:hypothetical protein